MATGRLGSLGERLGGGRILNLPGTSMSWVQLLAAQHSEDGDCWERRSEGISGGTVSYRLTLNLLHIDVYDAYCAGMLLVSESPRPFSSCWNLLVSVVP